MRVTNYVVGELSNADTHVLTKLARDSHRVLEFGSGGSTMIWAQFCPPDAEIVSVETNPEWIERTTKALTRLGARAVRFVPFDRWRETVYRKQWFDLVFIDGSPLQSRLTVAEQTWDLLMPTGRMAWHDTHTQPGLGDAVFQWLAPRHLEVSRVENEAAVTIATKCVPICIGNTDAFERREPWESGHAPLPVDWPRPR